MARRPVADVDLRVRVGLPYARRARVVGAALVWPGAAGAVVACQVRTLRSSRSTLLVDLAPYVTVAVVGADLAVTLTLPAATTAKLSDADDGFYELVVADADGGRGIRVMGGRFVVIDGPTTLGEVA